MQSRFFGLGFTGTVAFGLASMVALGCGPEPSTGDTSSSSSSSSSSTGNGGAGGGGEGGMGTAGGSSTGGMGGAGGGSSVCTGAEKSLCATFNVPADFSGTPAQFIFGLYKALPPAGPPDAGFSNPKMPMIVPGKPYQIEVTNLPAGDFYVYGASLVSAGFPPTPKSGDYQGSSAKTYTVGGPAVMADPIDLVKVP